MIFTVLAPALFSQDFSSSQTVSSYFSASAPGTGQFNDISSETDGGAWSITAGGKLQLVRAGLSGVNNGAGFTRWTNFAGPPTALCIQMDLGVTLNMTQSGAMYLELSKLTAVSDYNSSTPASNVFGTLSIDGAGANTYKISVNGTTSAAFPANGTVNTISLYANKSGAAIQFTAPDNSTQTLSNNAMSVWVGTTQALSNVAVTPGATSNLSGIRCRFLRADAGTWAFDNINAMAISPASDTTPPTVAITSPTTSPTYSTTSNTINLSGTAADNAGVTSVTWSNSLGGSGVAGGTTSWSATGIALYPGTNVLTVTVHDGANNTATGVLTVTYTPNQAPITVNHTWTLNENTTADVDVLANDSDPDNGPQPLSI